MHGLLVRDFRRYTTTLLYSPKVNCKRSAINSFIIKEYDSLMAGFSKVSATPHLKTSPCARYQMGCVAHVPDIRWGVAHVPDIRWGVAHVPDIRWGVWRMCQISDGVCGACARY